MQARKYALFVVFLGIFIFLFSLNFFSPPQGDDLLTPFFYESLINKSGTKAPILVRMAISYLSWNGRFGDLLFVGFVSGIPIHVFDFINAIIGSVAILLFFVLVFARTPKGKYDFLLLGLIIFEVLVLIPFDEMFLWMAGSVNYLWAWVLVLLSIIPIRLFWTQIFVRDSLEARLSKIPRILESSKIACILFCAINFIAGMSHEVFSVIVIFLHIIFIALAFMRKIKLPLWYKGAIFAFVAGFCALFFSPGQSQRSIIDANKFGEFLSISSFLALDFSDKMERIIEVLQNNAKRTPVFFTLFCFCVFFASAFKNLMRSKAASIAIFISAGIVFLFFAMEFAFLSFVLLGACFVYWAWREKSFKIASCVALLILWLIAVLSTFQFTRLPGRALIPQFLILSIIVMILFESIIKNKIASVIFGAIFGAYFIFVFVSHVDFYVKYQALENYIEGAKNEYTGELENCSVELFGKKPTEYACYGLDIVYPKEKWSFVYPYFGVWWELSDDATIAPNTAWAWQFKIRTLSVK